MTKAKPPLRTRVAIGIFGAAGVSAWTYVVFFFNEHMAGSYGVATTGLIRALTPFGAAIDLLFGLIVAVIAGIKGRSWIAWLAVGLWLWFLALLIVLVVPMLADELCPFCHERVKTEALVCPHCKRDLPIELEMEA
jgi:hypothetical protein